MSQEIQPYWPIIRYSRHVNSTCFSSELSKWCSFQPRTQGSWGEFSAMEQLRRWYIEKHGQKQTNFRIIVMKWFIYTLITNRWTIKNYAQNQFQKSLNTYTLCHIYINARIKWKLDLSSRHKRQWVRIIGQELVFLWKKEKKHEDKLKYEVWMYGTLRTLRSWRLERG